MRGGPSLKGKGGLVGFRKNLRLREDWWVFEKSLIKVNGKTGGLSKKIEMLVGFRKNRKKT